MRPFGHLPDPLAAQGGVAFFCVQCVQWLRRPVGDLLRTQAQKLARLSKPRPWTQAKRYSPLRGKGVGEMPEGPHIPLREARRVRSAGEVHAGLLSGGSLGSGSVVVGSAARVRLAAFLKMAS